MGDLVGLRARRSAADRFLRKEEALGSNPSESIDERSEEMASWDLNT